MDHHDAMEFPQDRGRQLFAERVPEAAARQLAVVLAFATEAHLATLEQMKSRTSTTRADLLRQTEIVAKLLFHCSDLRIAPRGLGGEACPRLERALTSLREERRLSRAHSGSAHFNLRCAP